MITAKQLVYILSASWLFASSHSVSANEDALSLEHDIKGVFSTTVDVPLNLVAGDYVEGQIRISKGDVNVGLHEAVQNTGTKMRLLLESVASGDQFRFVATEATQGLRLFSLQQEEGEIEYSLSITKQIPLAQQHPPKKSYLSPAITRLAEELKQKRTIEPLWDKMIQQGTPLIESMPSSQRNASQSSQSSQSENVIMTFVYRGAKNNVRLFGAPSNQHEFLDNLAGTDIWFKSFIVPSTTRLSYKLAPDIPEFSGTPWERKVALLAKVQADPLNKFPWPKQRFEERFSPFNYDSSVSLVTLPEAIYSKQKQVESGTLVKHRFTSKLLDNERNIWLYTSAGFDANDPDAILLLQFDGLKYTTKVPIPIILDNLVASDQLPPIAAIFIDNASRFSRAHELPDNPVFAKALVEEVLPWATGELNVNIDAQHTVLAGSSYGGLASSSIALRYPHTFGNALSMSGSYWWSPANTLPENEEYIANWVASTDVKPIRFFLSAGVFESGKGSGIGLLESNRHLRTVLQAKGYDVTYKEFAAGHDYFSWQQAFAEGMLALFGRE